MAKSKSDSLMEFAALTDEARRRGTSYGRLVAALLPGEDKQIIERYRKAKRTRENRKKTAAP